MKRRVRRATDKPAKAWWIVFAVVTAAMLSGSPRLRHMAFDMLDRILSTETSEAEK